jgi:hypothetical protein
MLLKSSQKILGKIKGKVLRLKTLLRSFKKTRKVIFQPITNNFTFLDKPYVFSSSLCREQHFRMPLYTYWCKKLGEAPKFHRKQWEFVGSSGFEGINV